jgi:hypothetical protein
MRPTQDFSKGLGELAGDTARFARIVSTLIFETIESMTRDIWQVFTSLPNLIVVGIPNRIVYDRHGEMRKQLSFFLLRPPR